MQISQIMNMQSHYYLSSCIFGEDFSHRNVLFEYLLLPLYHLFLDCLDIINFSE